MMPEVRELQTLVVPSRSPSRFRVAVILSMLLVVSSCIAVVNARAAFSDRAVIDMHTISSGTFSLGLVTPSGFATQVGAKRATLSYANEDRFVPGATARIDIRVFNNSPTIAANIRLSIVADGALADTVRFSASSASGGETVGVFGSPDEPEVNGLAAAVIPRSQSISLSPRISEPIAEGAVWSGPATSQVVLSVYVHLPNTDELRAVAHGSLSLTITISGSSL
ncbi:hypothetical protein BWO91_14775 [Plantibacter flavus]|nr:hypothetical protein BWO91_14775 [Plantibacter flavus]